MFKNILHKERMLFSAMNFPTLTECSFALDEKELFLFFVSLVRKFDPDVLMGYEVQKASLGYLLKRGEQLGEKKN